MHSRRAILIAMGLGLCAASPAASQPYPSHPITIVVPFAPGGATDVLPRMLGERLREALGQSVIIENVSGAGGTIGLGRVARAAPDGYTLVSGNWSTFVSNGAIYTLPYDLVQDFEPVVLLPSNSHLIATRKTLPAGNLSELLAWLKANQDKVSMATAGVGTGSHFAAVLLQSLTGTTFPLVHYRGGGPALQDLLSGQIDLMTNQAAVFLPQARAGSIKVFAVLAKERLVQAPEIPTADEAGMSGFHLSVWNGFWAPRGTPGDVIAKLNAAVVNILAEPELRQRLIDLAYEIPPRAQQTPAALGALQKAEIEKWWPIIKAAHVKAE
ncbi:MAG TPA: tripartite tricarboxylate transporter substrate-binding protein [Xanthobacteraceae bacterium]|nr:tripartite tricarboxylate transporter substrate-binding protein [Xanthobacteraceae bacterium]